MRASGQLWLCSGVSMLLSTARLGLGRGAAFLVFVFSAVLVPSATRTRQVRSAHLAKHLPSPTWPGNTFHLITHSPEWIISATFHFQRSSSSRLGRCTLPGHSQRPIPNLGAFPRIVQCFAQHQQHQHRQHTLSYLTRQYFLRTTPKRYSIGT